jgi:hypothetical protein
VIGHDESTASCGGSPFRLCGFVGVLAGLKPGEMMPVANADQANAEFRYGRPLTGPNPSPPSDRVDTQQCAPVLPPVNMVEGVIMLL